MNRDDFTGELDKIRCPALVLTGDEDLYCTPGECEGLARKIRGAELVVVPQCGHSSVLEQPEAVVAALKEFFASHAFRLKSRAIA